MKKTIVIMLWLMMILSLCACATKQKCSVEGCSEEAVEDDTYEEPYCEKHLSQKKAFDASKVAYDNINSAYEIVEPFGSDIYEAWRLAIYEGDDVIKDGSKHLAKELNLSEEEIRTGVAYFDVQILDKDWDSMDAETKQTYIDAADGTFSIMEDDLFTYCVAAISNAYKVNGKVDEAKKLLEEAKQNMKTLSDKYSDYEHYPSLKGYFTTTSSFFDFCQNPTGSFEQIETTMENYETTARNYKADLDYIFE